MAGRVKLCVDPTSPVGDYTFVYSDLNNQQGLPGNGFEDSGFWTDLGGDYFNEPAGFPSQLGDGSFTAFNPSQSGATIHNNGNVGTPDCVLALQRTTPSTAFTTALANNATAIDTWSGMTITSTTNNVVGGADYHETNCILDLGVILPQRKFDPLPAAWNSGTNYAIGDYATTGAAGSRQVWRALAANNNSAPAEGATWTNKNLGDCGAQNNPTRAFANFEHGIVVSFVFEQAPTTTTGQITPTQTSCEDYAKGTSSALSTLSAGFNGLKIHNIAPGVFFYYAHVTKGAGQAVGTTESASPNPGGLPLYKVHQGQAYVYTFNGSSCTTRATLGLTNNSTTVSGGASLPAGDYILGIKFNTGAPVGTVVPNASLTNSGALLATHNFQATVNGGGVPTTAASVDTKAK